MFPQRKQIRLKGYDYSQNGMYFITICTKNRTHFFGDVANGIMKLNDRGLIVKANIEKINHLYHGVVVDKYVIMPNHVHILIEVCRERIACVPNVNPTKSQISKIMQAFKSSVTKEIRNATIERNAYNAFPTEVWQSHFHDHIIRNQHEYETIHQYISENPSNWEDDCFYCNNNQITLNANAKLNLLLDIVGERDDGYHLMKMIMVEIDLCDEITMIVSKTDLPTQITVECLTNDTSLENLPPEKNIVYKAAMAFLKAVNINASVSIRLLKRVPSQAGMGGGSSDGASVIKGLNQLLETNLSLEQLIAIGMAVSADIPFCLCGGVALVEGIGEIIKPINSELDCFFVVIKPKCSVSTKEAFENFEKNSQSFVSPDFDEAIKALEKNDVVKASDYFANAFETGQLDNEILDAKEFLRCHGGIAPTMTGSGSAVFAIFKEETQAKEALAKCHASGYEAYICRQAKKVNKI